MQFRGFNYKRIDKLKNTVKENLLEQIENNAGCFKNMQITEKLIFKYFLEVSLKLKPNNIQGVIE